MTKTYTVTVTFTATEDSDDHLSDEQTVRDEFTSWLEDLGAEVKTVSVKGDVR